MQELERKFDEFGDVVSARVVRNPTNQDSRGYGFVEMKSDDAADKVLYLCVVMNSVWLQSFNVEHLLAQGQESW